MNIWSRTVSTICLLLGVVVYLPFEARAALPPTANDLGMIEAGWVFRKFQYAQYVSEARLWMKPHTTFESPHHDQPNPLFFRHQVTGQPWKYYRATRMYVPAYHVQTRLVREAVEGFELEQKSKGTNTFAYLSGIPFISPNPPPPVFFYEKRPAPFEPEQQTLNANTSNSANGATPSPAIPVDYLPALQKGLLVRFWNNAAPTGHTVERLDWVYDQFRYFERDGKRHRAVYIMRSVIPDQLTAGVGSVYGFEVRADGGMLLRHPLTHVTFLDTNKPSRIAANGLPVGTVISSTLNPEQFRESVGDPAIFDPGVSRWAPADNRGLVPGSDYASLVGDQPIPDLRGVFLRGQNAGRSDDWADPGPRDGQGFQQDALKIHSHGVRVAYHQSTSRGWSMTYNQPATGHEQSHLTQSGTANESRPKNYAVYRYIKINN